MGQIQPIRHPTPTNTEPSDQSRFKPHFGLWAKTFANPICASVHFSYPVFVIYLQCFGKCFDKIIALDFIKTMIFFFFAAEGVLWKKAKIMQYYLKFWLLLDVISFLHLTTQWITRHTKLSTNNFISIFQIWNISISMYNISMLTKTTTDWTTFEDAKLNNNALYFKGNS